MTPQDADVAVVLEDLPGVEDAPSSPYFVARVARNAWEAFDALDEEWDLVICDFALRFGNERLHSALWRERPDLKARFVFVVDAAAPQTRALRRPLTATAILSALDRFGDPPRS